MKTGIFRPNRDEKWKWRKLHSEELHSLYCSPNVVRAIKCRRLRLAGHVVRMEECKSALKILAVKPTENITLGRSRLRLEKILERWAAHVARMEEGRSAFTIIADKPTGKIPLGRSRPRLENNIRMMGSTCSQNGRR